MTSLSERIALIIDFNGDKAIKGLENVARASQGADKESRDLQKSLTSMGATGLAASGIAAVGLSKLAGKASDLNEVTSKTNVIFGDAADSVIAFAKDAGKALGQSETAALEAATGVAQMGKAAGFAGQDLADFSTDLVTLASDLASFNNTSPEEAIQALGAALRGESEPIRAYNVLLDDATLKQRALSMGLIETTTGTLPPAIKVQAAYAEILAQTTDAQGDFARTADGAANQQRILKAEIENLATGIGTGLLPAFSAVVSGAADAVGALNSMSDESKTMLGTLAAGGVGVVAALSGVSLLTGQLMKLRERFTDVVDGSRSLTTAGKIATTAAVGVGVFSAAVALIQANAAKAERAIDDLQAEMSDTGDTAEIAASRLLLEWVFANDEAREAMEETKLSTEDLQRAIYGSGQEYDRVKGKLRELGVQNKSMAAAAYELQVQIDKQRDAYKGNAREVKAAQEAEKALAAEQNRANETKGESARLNAVLGESLEDAALSAEELAEEEEELAKRLEDTADAMDAAEQAAHDLLKTTTDLYLASLDYDELLETFPEKIDELREAHDEVTKAEKEHGAGSDQLREAHLRQAAAIRDIQRTLPQVAAEALKMAEAQAALENRTLTADQAMQVQKQALLQFAQTFPEVKQAVDDFMNRGLDPLIEKSRDTATEIESSANRAAAAWRNADGQITATADRIAGEQGITEAPPTPAPTAAPPRRASGGYVVGDKATENTFGGAMPASAMPAQVTLVVRVEAGNGAVMVDGAQLGGFLADKLTEHTRRNGTTWLNSIGVR